MPITTQSADGITHEFPDDTKPEVVDKVMKEYAEKRKDKSTTLGSIGHGLMDPIEGSAQLLEHMTPEPIRRGVNELNNVVARKTGLTQELPVEGAMDAHAKQREAQIQAERGANTGMDWPRLAGNLLNPINYIGAGLGPELKAGMGAAERLTVGLEKGEIAGATAGAMEPATKDNYWTEKAMQTGVGALTGAALGGLFSGASEGVMALGEHLARTNPDSLLSDAVTKILKRIKSDEASGGPTAAQAIDLVNASKKPVTLADVSGEDAKGLAGHVTRQPGEGRNFARQFLRERDEQAAQRLDADISQHLHGGPTVFQSVKAMLNARSATARPAYDEVHTLQNVWSPRLQEFLDSPDVKKGLARGYEIESNYALAEGRPITATQLGVDMDTQGNIKMVAAPNMRLLDMAKQGLDAMIADTRNEFTGRLSQYGISLDKVRRAFVGEMDALDTKGVYKNARKTWAGYSSSIDAIKLGQSVFTSQPEEFAAEIGEMSPANREFLRIGVADKLREKLSKVGLSGDESKSLIKNSWMRKQLRPAFKSEEEFNAFADAVSQETNMFETARKIVGGSQTAERAAEDMSEQKGPLGEVLERMLGGAHIFGIRDAYKLWRDIGFKPDPKLNAKIAEILFSTHVEPDIGMLLRGGKTPPKVNPAAGAAGATRGVGAAAAPMATVDLTKERSPQIAPTSDMFQTKPPGPRSEVDTGRVMSDAAPVGGAGQKLAMSDDPMHVKQRDPMETESELSLAGGRGGGGPGKAAKVAEPPPQLENALSEHARGNISAKEVQKIFKKEGWQVDMRRGRYDYEIFDPSGKAHYVVP